MPFCSSCGAELQGKYCARCGALGGGPAPAASFNAAGLQENIAGALCYSLGVLTGILFLVLEPYSKNRTIRFHAFQAIFAWIAVVAVSIVLQIITHSFMLVPFVGWVISACLWTAFGVGVFILWLLLMYKAYNNEKWVLPIIGPLAEKQL
jgi:uncharacterized membrane protein